MMTSRLLALHSSIFIAAACVISIYVIYALDVIGLRHTTLTTWESHVNFTTDTRCPGSGIAALRSFPLLILQYTLVMKTN